MKIRVYLQILVVFGIMLVPGVCRPYQPKPYDDDDDNDADHLRTKYPTGIDIIIFD